MSIAITFSSLQSVAIDWVELYYSFTPTANAESWAVEAFSLCMFLFSTKLSEWSPMERRAPAQGSSRDQRI